MRRLGSELKPRVPPSCHSVVFVSLRKMWEKSARALVQSRKSRAVASARMRRRVRAIAGAVMHGWYVGIVVHRLIMCQVYCRPCRFSYLRKPTHLGVCFWSSRELGSICNGLEDVADHLI